MLIIRVRRVSNIFSPGDASRGWSRAHPFGTVDAGLETMSRWVAISYDLPSGALGRGVAYTFLTYERLGWDWDTLEVGRFWVAWRGLEWENDSLATSAYKRYT